MPHISEASPRISVRLYKSIDRKTVDGQTAVSVRYQGKAEYIDLTEFMNDGASVRTSKSVRQPAGAFSITFADMPQKSLQVTPSPSASALESVYGLVEPMDMIEIRMWNGVGSAPNPLPIKMRGFVTEIQRGQAIDDEGRPQRQVVVSGQDYGKIWQMFQVIYLAAYADRQALLTNFGLWELFGVDATNTMKSGEFVRTMITKIINPFIDKFMPKNSPMPREIKTGDSISVAHGVINNSYQSAQGSIYDIMKIHGDVGVWNELYVQDREDSVHCVYRPVPALKLTADKDGNRKIQEDAPDPIYVNIYDRHIKRMTVSRSDADVANFYWVNNSRYDLIDDMQRKLESIPKDDGRVSLKEYPNSAVKYYATRPMYADTQQGGDLEENMGSGLSKDKQEKRTVSQADWLDYRRKAMVEMNKDNVVYERGQALVKGGLLRESGEPMQAGDYARFKIGKLEWIAYVTQIDDEFNVFRSYTTSLTFERGEGFVARSKKEGGIESPWLNEQASRGIVNL